MKKKLLFSLFVFSTYISLFSNPRLSDYSNNVYSQFGEDGIIERILDCIGSGSKISVEFGAWDGFQYSNTANLWAHHGWQGILIECNDQYYQDLVKNVSCFNCIPIYATVGMEKENSIEAILESYHINTPIDLLSIDIDGNDYHILTTLHRIHPRILVCEYNPSIPSHIDMYADYGNSFGASIKAIARIAAQKGYQLVATTTTNAIFVDQDLAKKLKFFDLAYENIVSDAFGSYIITDYSGNFMVIGDRSCFPWGIQDKKISAKLNGNFFDLSNYNFGIKESLGH